VSVSTCKNGAQIGSRFLEEVSSGHANRVATSDNARKLCQSASAEQAVVSRVETKLVDRKKPALLLSGSTIRASGNRGSSTVTKCSLAILVVGLRPLIGQSA
jgi:DNA topoisomerase IA